MVSDAAWWSIGLVIAGAVLSMLHTLGATITNERHVREVHGRVRTLKAAYARRMAEINDEEVILVDAVASEPALHQKRAA